MALPVKHCPVLPVGTFSSLNEKSMGAPLLLAMISLDDSVLFAPDGDVGPTSADVRRAPALAAAGIFKASYATITEFCLTPRTLSGSGSSAKN